MQLGLTIFIIGAALIGLGLIALTSAGRTRGNLDNSDPLTRLEFARRRGTRNLGALLIIIGSFMVFLDSFTIVGAREVAVQTVFGRVQDPVLKAGWHWVAPWNNVEKFDASVKTLKFYQGQKEDDNYDGGCLTVRLGNNTPACVDVTAQWNINHEGDVKELYLKYRTFDNIHDNLVTRQLQSALNEVFGTYDPLNAVGTAAEEPTVNTKALQDKVRISLQTALGDNIHIDSVTIPIVHFDGPTEDRLKAYQQAKADTRIAEQNRLTAAAQANAARILALQPGIEKEGVRFQNCLNFVADLAKLDQLKNLPPVFTCQRNGTPVLIQTK